MHTFCINSDYLGPSQKIPGIVLDRRMRKAFRDAAEIADTKSSPARYRVEFLDGGVRLTYTARTIYLVEPKKTLLRAPHGQREKV
jgi:hypothetical protein